ncbi:MAG: HD-GYP domain-containing protein [Candidatus Omnitrophota bacterium]
MAEKPDKSQEKLLRYFYIVAKSLVHIIEARDHYTKGHSEKVAAYAVKIARKMGFSEDGIELLEETAFLHDIGKLGIDEDILDKKEKLTDEEWEAIRRHPIIGEDMLRPITLRPELLTLVRTHHERYDGKGYPDKLTGDNISVFAAILSVADAYDAMTTEKPYRHAMTKEEAIEELKRCSGSQFNPKIVDIFLSII